MTEQEIIQGCKQGDARAQRALVDRYSAKLMAICMRYMREKELAKDVLQESFILIFKNIRRFEKMGSFEGWLCRIAVNASLTQLRSKKIIQQDLSYAQEFISNDASVLENLAAEDILKKLDQLNPNDRLIFNLYVVEGYKHNEIAKMLEINESTSRSQLSRARDKVKKMFSKFNEKIILL